jgi:transcriptional regulator with XRE-family HTH domain
MISKEKLKQLYFEEGMTQGEIADELGYSQPFISRKMSEYSLDSGYSFWDEKEVQFLKENYRSMPRDEIMESFPDRTWGAVKDKARELGVAMSAKERAQSDELLDLLRRNAEENMVEVDFSLTDEVSYILGVLDGDGYTDNQGTLGLEAKDQIFTEKFKKILNSVGFNPSSGRRRGKNTVWASSLNFTEWYEDLSDEEKLKWLKEEGSLWKYVEGQYESDGNLHPSGSPRICSYDQKEKEMVKKIFHSLGIEANIQQNNVWVAKKDASRFFAQIEPVIRKPESKSEE